MQDHAESVAPQPVLEGTEVNNPTRLCIYLVQATTRRNR